jgi:hypothetical protein
MTLTIRHCTGLQLCVAIKSEIVCMLLLLLLQHTLP